MGVRKKGNVFGAGKGVAESFWCEKAMVYKTTVTISGGTVKNNSEDSGAFTPNPSPKRGGSGLAVKRYAYILRISQEIARFLHFLWKKFAD